MLDFSITFAITFVNIVFLYVVLKKILWKPVTAFMEKRTDKIKSEYAQAAAELRKAEELRSNYEARLKDADKDAEQIIRDARDEAQDAARAIVEQGKAEAERIKAAARAELEREHAAAAARLEREAAFLAVLAAERILARRTGADDERLAQRAVAAAIAESGRA